MSDQTTQSSNSIASNWVNIAVGAGAVAVSLLLTSIIIIVAGAHPVEVFEKLVEGMGFSARGFNALRFSGVVNFWIPLMLVSTGLLVTFMAGLWNIGVEGQMMMGAIFATGIALFVDLPALLLVPLEIAAAAIGGALWAMLAAVLKTRGGVHEIFGGVALNSLASIFGIYLTSGPWGDEGGQATPLFQDDALLYPMHSEFQVSLVALIVMIVGFIIIAMLLRGTRWGLELKSLGKSPRSALLLGVATEKNTLLAMAACGVMAGMAGSMRVLFTYGNLRPLVSGGIGYLGLMVVLLTGTRAIGVPLVSFFFAAILAGSTRLKIALRLDQSLSGVIQGMLVLVFILANGVRGRFLEQNGANVIPDKPAPQAEEVSHG